MLQRTQEKNALFFQLERSVLVFGLGWLSDQSVSCHHSRSFVPMRLSHLAAASASSLIAW